MTEKEFRQLFAARTKESREKAGFSQEGIAKLLRIDQGRYKNYELDRPLPHYLVPQFCIACHIEPTELYAAAPVVTRQRAPRRRKRLAA